MNYYLEKAIKLNADGIDFVPMSIGNVPNIIASYTREELENVKGFPKTNYLFYKIVNGRKEYINLDKQKEVVMTRFENIQKMNIEEMAKFFSTNSLPDLPHSPCTICQHNEEISCAKPDACTTEYKMELYKKWLSEESSIQLHGNTGLFQSIGTVPRIETVEGE